ATLAPTARSSNDKLARTRRRRRGSDLRGPRVLRRGETPSMLRCPGPRDPDPRSGSMTAMPRATVTEVVECLDDEFHDFAEGFCRGDYLLWLGSGLSRDVVPNVSAIIERMLEFLREHVADPGVSCRFSRALDEVLDVAVVPAATRTSLDYSIPVN